LLSWLLALVHVPLMAGRMLKQDKKDEEQGETIYEGRTYQLLHRVLYFCMGHRWTVTLGMLVLLLLTLLGYPKMRQGFFPDGLCCIRSYGTHSVSCLSAS
jgi:multidrug efflux pump subunit AcrB